MTPRWPLTLNSWNPYCIPTTPIQIKGAKPLYVAALYRQPDNHTQSLIDLQASLEKLPQNAHILLLGDFNLPDVSWPDMYFKPGGRYPADSKLIL